MTYTFSRALYMMRYGKAKMKDVIWEDSHYLKVDDGILWETINNGKEWFGATLGGYEIMGNWEKV